LILIYVLTINISLLKELKSASLSTRVVSSSFSFVEALPALFVLVQVWLKQLEGDCTLEASIFRFVRHAPTTSAEFLDVFIM